MGDQENGLIVMRPVRIPAAVIDGAVAELASHPDGTITAEIRIPARQPERM